MGLCKINLLSETCLPSLQSFATNQPEDAFHGWPSNKTSFKVCCSWFLEERLDHVQHYIPAAARQPARKSNHATTRCSPSIFCNLSSLLLIHPANMRPDDVSTSLFIIGCFVSQDISVFSSSRNGRLVASHPGLLPCWPSLKCFLKLFLVMFEGRQANLIA